jgi:hypothetical protein
MTVSVSVPVAAVFFSGILATLFAMQILDFYVLTGVY